MTRKSPTRHRVKSHTRKGKRVNSFLRGSGNQKVQTKRMKVKIKKEKKEHPWLTTKQTKQIVKDHEMKKEKVQKPKKWKVFHPEAEKFTLTIETAFTKEEAIEKALERQELRELELSKTYWMAEPLEKTSKVKPRTFFDVTKTRGFKESDRDVVTREMALESGFKLKKNFPDMIEHRGKTFYHTGRHGLRTLDNAKRKIKQLKTSGHHINDSAIIKIGRSYHIYSR